MKLTSTITIGLAIAASMPNITSQHCLAQSDSVAPAFRPRTDANAVRDLQLLREALNQASDSEGAINPLGKFLQRNAETQASEQTAAPKSEERDPRLDREAEQKPRLDLRGGKNSDRTDTPRVNTKEKESSSIGILPGPHYYIVQQASPRYSDRIVDNFLPAPQYPVSLASSSIPIPGVSNVVRANFQEIPGTGAALPSGIPGVFPNNFATNIPIQTQPQLDGSVPPGLPFNNQSIPVNPGLIPNNSQVFPGATATQGNPPINNPPINNPAAVPGYINPGVPNPSNPTQIYTPQPYYPPQSNAPPRSSSDVMPNYPQPTTMVNGLPFVSGPPCQFDARYMVSRNAYRQSADPCAPVRGCGTGYATQPGGGSPFSYAPPTYMPTNNNGYDSGFRPLIGFGQTLNNAYLGRGIVGQPVAYVDSQPVRNFIRYLFP